MTFKRFLILALLLAALCGALVLTFLAYQHPALLLDFGNVLSCG